MWTTEQVAEFLGIPARNVRKQLSRWGVGVHDREPGKGGANRYLAEAVKEAKAKAPGRAWRASEKNSDTDTPASAP